MHYYRGIPQNYHTLCSLIHPKWVIWWPLAYDVCPTKPRRLSSFVRLRLQQSPPASLWQEGSRHMLMTEKYTKSLIVIALLESILTGELNKPWKEMLEWKSNTPYFTSDTPDVVTITCQSMHHLHISTGALPAFATWGEGSEPGQNIDPAGSSIF